MASINIEISEELHKKIKIKSIMYNSTLKDYIISKLQEGLVVVKQKKPKG
jgi:hypothetical protein